MIDRTGICDLFLPDINLVEEAVYPIAKALGRDLDVQQAFFEGVATVVRGGLPRALRDYLLGSAERLDAEARVDAAQLVQFCWQGFGLWERKWDELAHRCSVAGEAPILVSYAALAGLVSFVKHIPHFYLLMPSWLSLRGCMFCGYEFESAGGGEHTVNLFPKGKRFPREAPLVIDDTIRTEGTMGTISSYLKLCGASAMRIEIPCDARVWMVRTIPVDGTRIELL